MFSGCTNLESVDFGDCDFSKVANMQFMFENCPNLKVARFGNTYTTSLQYCKAVFSGCSWMTELNLGPNFTISIDPPIKPRPITPTVKCKSLILNSLCKITYVKPHK